MEIVDDFEIRANALKEEGNGYLVKHLYTKAAEKYTEAIALNPTSIYFSNRAQALIKLESYGSAIADANEALKLDPNYIKAYYRRASANFALGKLKEALRDLKAVAKIVPKDQDCQKKLKACEKAMRELAFTKAIETEDGISIKSIDVDNIIVDSSYSGPHLIESVDGTLVTMDFVRELIAYLRDQKILHRKYVLKILVAAREYFESLPSLLEIPIGKPDKEGVVIDRITVCGDTHGQYYDLLNIFEIGGFPSVLNPYLFNGDFVDRGSFSFENVFTLIAIKLACPTALHLLRGNHETRNMNKMYGFEGEVKHKYDNVVMDLFTEVFNRLPLAAVIGESVFVVHGGLSTGPAEGPSNASVETAVKLSDIQAIKRCREPPVTGLMSDLLWTDPQSIEGRSPSKRGMGFSFGPDYTEAFLAKNGLDLVVRSHEVKPEGYEWEHNGKCVTVFSAPNYCDQMQNKGAFIRFDLPPNKTEVIERGEHVVLTPKFVQFDAVPHPNIPAMRYAGDMFGL